jgi:thioredoxin-like negative regulator of GroEL
MQTLPQDPLKLMSQIAALCSDLGLSAQALAIFEHLVLLRDENPNALVSLAVAHSRAGNETAALVTLKRALVAEPAHDMARVMLAIHLHKAGDPQGRALLSAAMLDAQDSDALALAASVKDEILNTTPAPERVTRHRYTRVDTESTDI